MFKNPNNLFMKRLLLIFIVMSYFQIANSQDNCELLYSYYVYNSVTKKLINEDEGVTATYTSQNFKLVVDKSKYSLLLNSYQFAFHTEFYNETQTLPVHESISLNLKNLLSFKITFSGPGYESQSYLVTYCSIYNNFTYYSKDMNNSSTSDAEKRILNQIARESCSSDVWGSMGQIYLVPKRTVIDGNLNVKTTSVERPANDLGLITTLEIANRLSLKENDIINFILKGELKAKKIGEKYFVRKEDFDAFMKK